MPKSCRWCKQSSPLQPKAETKTCLWLNSESIDHFWNTSAGSPAMSLQRTIVDPINWSFLQLENALLTSFSLGFIPWQYIKVDIAFIIVGNLQVWAVIMRSGKSTQDSFSEHRCFSTDEVPVELESRTFHHGVSLTVVPFTWHLYRPEDIKFRRQFYAAANHPRSNEPTHSSHLLQSAEIRDSNRVRIIVWVMVRAIACKVPKSLL